MNYLLTAEGYVESVYFANVVIRSEDSLRKPQKKWVCRISYVANIPYGLIIKTEARRKVI
jgi:hypothetical protein